MGIAHHVLVVAAVGTTLFHRPAASQETARDLRVYFDCNAFCDDDYVRTVTPWVAFVRDRTDADVHLLITSVGTGAAVGPCWCAATARIGARAYRRR